MEGLKGFMEDTGSIQIPNLDWSVLNVEDKVNLPSKFHVQIIPQLQEAWCHEPSTMKVVPHTDREASYLKPYKASDEDIKGVVDTAKKAMMLGVSGKPLADKLASLYHPSLIEAAKPELRKIAEEQGLLGNVYLDMSVFASCEEAARVLGNNKVRLARYVVGNPYRQACSSHKGGFCKCLRKKVVASMNYDDAIFSEYTDHLRIAKILGPQEKIASKEELRTALFQVRKAEVVESTQATSIKSEDYAAAKKAFDEEIESNTKAIEGMAQVTREADARPVLAFIQNEMLKGKMGFYLKEAIEKKFPENIIAKYAPYIKKMAALQGLIGNVYVDVSMYKTAEEAIAAIKNATTSPMYLIQSAKKNKFDNTLEKVAKATGCVELPRDGKIESKVAGSYIDDLQFSNKISSENANLLRKTLNAGENPIQVLRDAFVTAMNHKSEVREGGVPGYFHQMTSKKSVNRENLKQAAYQAINAGIPLDKVESKIASVVPTTEAVGMIRSILASVKEVDANCLPDCTTEKYLFNKSAFMIQRDKCKGCIYHSCSSCLQTGLRFKGASDVEGDLIKIDAKTKKVLFDENPDEARSDMKQEYDLSSPYGSGSSVALDKMRDKEASLDVDVSFGAEGIDSNLK
jgi:hypothetical protein